MYTPVLSSPSFIEGTTGVVDTVVVAPVVAVVVLESAVVTVLAVVFVLSPPHATMDTIIATTRRSVKMRFICGSP